MMRSILDQLDGDEAVLLMYLAGELPQADHMAVEQRLAADGQLRAQLDVLRTSQQQISRLLDRLDASHPMPVSAASSQRAVSRSMQQWQADQLLRGSRAHTDAAVRSRWIWAGPAAAAAVLLISWSVWWGIQPDKYAPIADAASSELATDDNTTDVVADDPDLDDSRELASIIADMNTLQSLSELTTFTQ